MCPYPFLEVTPPGAAPGPPVKTGPVFVASGVQLCLFERSGHILYVFLKDQDLSNNVLTGFVSLHLPFNRTKRGGFSVSEQVSPNGSRKVATCGPLGANDKVNIPPPGTWPCDGGQRVEERVVCQQQHLERTTNSPHENRSRAQSDWSEIK